MIDDDKEFWEGGIQTIKGLQVEVKRLSAENERLRQESDYYEGLEEGIKVGRKEMSAEIKTNDRRYRMAQDRANDDIECLSAEGALKDAVVEAARVFLENDKTQALTGSKQLKDALERVSTGLTKADISPKTATEKDGINDRGSDEYANPERDGDRQ